MENNDSLKVLCQKRALTVEGLRDEQTQEHEDPNMSQAGLPQQISHAILAPRTGCSSKTTATSSS